MDDMAQLLAESHSWSIGLAQSKQLRAQLIAVIEALTAQQLIEQSNTLNTVG